MPNIEVPLWFILTELTNGRRRIPGVVSFTMDYAAAFEVKTFIAAKHNGVFEIIDGSKSRD